VADEDLPTLLRQEQETNLILQETIADLELAVEDRSWTRLTTEANSEFSHGGRQMITSLCRMVAIANPLVKRCLMLRIAYIWGGGVSLSARDDKVQEIVQEFWDDNAAVLSGSQAQEELERALGTDGNVFLAAFTSPLTGRVQMRSIPQDEILDIITNPEDRDEPWFYIREYTRQSLGGSGGDPTVTQVATETVKVVYPALGYTPASRIKNLNGGDVRWDAPVLHVSVNRLDGWRYGIPDVYASLAWARAYKDFLTDWALLTKSLAKFAWKVTGDTKSRANKAIAAIQQSVTDSSSLNNVPNTAGTAGQIAGSGPGLSLDAIPKAGAHIDADSGRPLAAMVAAGFGVPVTMALADPGVTGARATARTLDKPTQLEMEMRRSLWQGRIGELLDYVIDQSVIAPKGSLKGTGRVVVGGRRKVELTGNTKRTVDWDWPELAEIDPVQLINGIVSAEPFIPPETATRLLLNALDVDDVDELVDGMKDDQGDFVPPAQAAQAAAVNSFQAGGPPPQGFTALGSTSGSPVAGRKTRDSREPGSTSAQTSLTRQHTARPPSRTEEKWLPPRSGSPTRGSTTLLAGRHPLPSGPPTTGRPTR
jgi:hypothetical protein